MRGKRDEKKRREKLLLYSSTKKSDETPLYAILWPIKTKTKDLNIKSICEFLPIFIHFDFMRI
jgi:hypothetical protein